MTLTRGARITGAVLCAVLAAMAFAWIVRDIRAADGPMNLWEYLGAPDPRSGQPMTTAQGSRVLLVTYVLAAVAALRSSSAASSVLVITGVVTLAMKLPGTWSIDDTYPVELRDRAELGLYVALAAAVALIVAGIAGRRPSPEAVRPAGPGQGAGVAAFLLLGAVAVVSLAWEIRQPFVVPSGIYPAWFLGGAPVHSPMTEAPPGWESVVLVLMSLVAAFGAVVRAAFARVLGLIAGGLSFLGGVLGTAFAVRFEMYENFADLPLERQLSVLTSLFLVVVGAAVIAVLARPGAERTSGGLPGPWGGSGPWGVQPPGYPPAPGPGVPPQAPGHPPYGVPGQPPASGPGVPPQAPGHPPAQAPGFGPPQDGGFGPPPPSPPPGR
ncbi:hypothetical protein ACIQPT_33710 [Streptomyces sp. NPDC091289]|uniref:hypothetical protein n=1 Tax=Streptomyces sp. NPDC091289 TaxID=3365989 RepID=UPI0037F67C21